MVSIGCLREGLSRRQPRRECRAIVSRPARQLGVAGTVSLLLDDGAVEAIGGGNHPRVGLREHDDGTRSRQLWRCLSEPPRVEDDLADLVAVGEFADFVDAVEDALVAVVDVAPTW